VTSRRNVLIVGGLALWFVAVMVFWAFRPMTDRVPTTLDKSQTPNRTLVLKAACNAPAQIAARSKPVPVLPSQPAGEPPVTFLHEPCIALHREANLLFIVDLIVMAGLVAGGVWFVRRSGRHALATTSAASGQRSDVSSLEVSG
jgi:hypothetical protein